MPKEKVQKEKQQSTKHKQYLINLRHIFVSLFCENISLDKYLPIFFSILNGHFLIIKFLT